MKMEKILMLNIINSMKSKIQLHNLLKKKQENKFILTLNQKDLIE
jgi:hypothetical protein